MVEMIGEIEEDISNELIKQAASEMISSKVCPLCTCTCDDNCNIELAMMVVHSLHVKHYSSIKLNCNIRITSYY